MKKFIGLGVILISPIIYSQVGINTGNPKGIFHVDGAKDNPDTGTPSVTQTSNDFVVTKENVGIGTGTPNTSAILELNVNALPSNGKKGFLPPSVSLISPTDGTTIPSPSTGLMVYNDGNAPGLANSGYYYNAGTPSSPSWSRIASVGDIPIVGDTKAFRWSYSITAPNGTVNNETTPGSLVIDGLMICANNQAAGAYGVYFKNVGTTPITYSFQEFSFWNTQQGSIFGKPVSILPAGAVVVSDNDALIVYGDTSRPPEWEEISFFNLTTGRWYIVRYAGFLQGTTVNVYMNYTRVL